MANQSRFRDLVSNLFKRDQIIEPVVGDGEPSFSPISSYYRSRMELSSNRVKRYKDYRDMGEDTLISGALDMYADEATQFERQEGASVWVVSNNKDVEKDIRRMLDATEMEEQIPGVARYTAQMGDNPVRPLADKNKGIVAMEFLEAEDFERLVDKYARLVGFRILPLGDRSFDPWDIVHFRIMNRTQTVRHGGSIYGTSVLENARKTWRQLTLLEDQLVIYRLEVGGRHRVFYIDVGSVSHEQALATTRKYERQFGRKQYFNPQNGEWTSRFTPLQLTSEIFWPVRGESQSRIEYLGTDPNVQGIADLEYFRNKLFASLKIPKAYIGGDEYCLSGDTKVYMLDGTYKTMQELSENHANETLWVIAYDTETKKFKPGKAHSFRKTRINEPTYRVSLDNGKHVDVSFNERFLLRNGTYRQAIDLKAGDSLMPFNLSHKVVGVEYIGNNDLYDMEVDDFHNFGLEAGVVVHNSSAKYGLAQVDIAFARSVQRLQRSVINGITRMGQIHLSFLGKDPTKREHQFQIMMSPPSTLDQEQRMEALDLSLTLSMKMKQIGEALGLDDAALNAYIQKTMIGLTPYDLTRINSQTPGGSPMAADDKQAVMDHLIRLAGTDPDLNGYKGRGERGEDIYPPENADVLNESLIGTYPAMDHDPGPGAFYGETTEEEVMRLRKALRLATQKDK